MRLAIKYKKKMALILLCMLSCLLLPVKKVAAANSIAVVETYTGESEIVLYIKGVRDEQPDIRVQTGTAACASVTWSRLSETRQPVKTMILLDNSLSVQKANRQRITKLIQSIITDRMENEQMALAVFNEGTVYLTDYTSDEGRLLEAAEDIHYEKTQTYLTDVLYELLLSEYVRAKEDVFYRIVVISDGMDHKSIGYTKEELTDLLKEHPVPVYTVGVQTGKKNNQKQLKNMFAIARLTGADSFLLNEADVLTNINQALRKDHDIVRLSAVPADERMDGSRQTVKLSFDVGEDISAEMVMPQPMKETNTKTVHVESEHTAQEDTQKDKQNGFARILKMGLPITLAIAGLIVLSAVVFTIWLKKKKKEENAEYKQEQPYDLRQEAQIKPQKTPEQTETEWMPDAESVTETEIEGNMETPYHIMLTDIHTPARTFQVPMHECVVIGRTQGICTIVLDYDRSVSGRHCKIELRNDKFYVTDLNSKNGTSVEGRKITEETEIFSGNILKLGRLACRFEVLFGQEEI